MTRFLGCGLVLSLIVAMGCEGSGGGDKSSPAATKSDPASTGAAKPTGVAAAGTAPAAAAGTWAAAPGTAAANAAGTAAGTSPGAGLSAVPTTAEWDAASEVTVKGSSALGCETKAVREYLRVSCKGENNTGGKPTYLNVTKGDGRPGMFKYMGSGITSLIVPFVEGVDVAADFSWSNKTHTLTIQWPRGAPKPPAYGAFDAGRPNTQ
jgi:hypothetical protein